MSCESEDNKIKLGKRQTVDSDKFNPDIELPYGLRIADFDMAMQDVYDFFNDINSNLKSKSMPRFDDMLRPAMMSGLLSDLLTASLANHSRTLSENTYFNGHPDLVVTGVYESNSVKSGEEGVEIKATKKAGGAVDTHGARNQWMCVFVYRTDSQTEPANERHPTKFVEVYLGPVTVNDFRKNDRGELGTRTATLHADGIKKLREGWVYLDKE